MSKERESSELLSKQAKLKCCVIGIGNAGNQILNDAHSAGMEVFAINSSKQDLDDSLINQQIRSFIIGNEARGAGKNRAVAKALFKINGKKLVNEIDYFKNMCSSNDIIIVAGSAAGGTGSGVSPTLINILKKKYQNKIIIAYGILPRVTDSITAQQNSIDYIHELNEIKVPYILADLEYYKGTPNDVAYTSIAKHIVDSIGCIDGKYINKSSHGMIDENDMRTLISEPGYISIYNMEDINQKQIDAESAQQMMIKKIKSSPAVDIMRDGIVRKMGVIINMPEEMLDSSKNGDYEELIKYIGRPITSFENYAITNSALGQIVLILSGQSMPYARMDVMEKIVNDAMVIYNKKKEYSLESSYKAIEEDIPAFLQVNEEIDDSELDDLFDSI